MSEGLFYKVSRHIKEETLVLAQMYRNWSMDQHGLDIDPSMETGDHFQTNLAVK